MAQVAKHACVWLLLGAALEALFPFASGSAPFGRQSPSESRPEVSPRSSCPELRHSLEAGRNALPTADFLTAAYNEQARSVSSLIIRAQVIPQEANARAAALKELHEIGIMLFADRPGQLRVIGIDPVVGMHLFDFASDGKVFSLLVPRRRQFFTGKSGSRIVSNTLFDRMDPQDLLDALFWGEALGASTTGTGAAGKVDPHIRFSAIERSQSGAREVTLDRDTLRIKASEFFDAAGALVSSVQYESWTSAETAEGKNACYPHKIRIARSVDGYHLEMLLTSAAVNVQIPRDRFYLAQPASVQRIELPQ